METKVLYRHSNKNNRISNNNEKNYIETDWNRTPEDQNETGFFSGNYNDNFHISTLLENYLKDKCSSTTSIDSVCSTLSSLDLSEESDSEESDKSNLKSLTKKASPVLEEDGRVNYFPNCDARVWLRSCTHPIEEPIKGVKLGVIPVWLQGSLIRNGPGRMNVGDDTYNHIFDGSALLHRFHFKNGNVTYRNQFLQSRSFLKDSEANRIVVNHFGTKGHPDPCKSILQNIASRFSFEEQFSDNAQISVYPYGDGLYALTEAPYIYRIDPDTLETHEMVDMTKYLTIFNHTAHPHVEKDGNVYNIGQGVSLTGPVYHICQYPDVAPFENAKIVGSVKAQWILNPCYMHSFGITKNYFVLIEQPLAISTPKIIKRLVFQEALIHALQWWDAETKFHVVHRETGEVHTITYETESFFFLHVINTYEESDHIIIDICVYKDAKMLDCMFTESLRNASYDPSYARMFRGRPRRWVLPLKPRSDAIFGGNLCSLPTTSCTAKWINNGNMFLQSELLADIGCEVPQINYEEYNGKKYRYFYAICSDVDHPNPGTLVKVDVQKKCHWEWSEENVYPSEPIFVPAPNSKEEDDGVILSALLRCKGLDNQVCLLVLDASTFEEKGRVDFECNGPVPKCLHGKFVPQGTLKGVHSINKNYEEETSKYK